MDSDKIVMEIIEALEDKKAKDIKQIDIRYISTLADYFIICSGTSSTHIKALCESVNLKMKLLDYSIKKIEGYQTAQWILMDYGDVIVNIFEQTQREFYSLERLWVDAKIK